MIRRFITIGSGILLLIYSFSPQYFVEYLLCIRYCARSWVSVQPRQTIPCPLRMQQFAWGTEGKRNRVSSD